MELELKSKITELALATEQLAAKDTELKQKLKELSEMSECLHKKENDITEMNTKLNEISKIKSQLDEANANIDALGKSCSLYFLDMCSLAKHWCLLYHIFSIKFGVLNNCLAPVFRKMDNSIHQINRYPVDCVQFVYLTLICWIVIYLVDRAINPSNNRYQVSKLDRTLANKIPASKLLNALSTMPILNLMSGHLIAKMQYMHVQCKYSIIHK